MKFPLLIAAILACGSLSAAAAERIDDSGSRVLGTPLTRMRWDTAPGRMSDTVVGQTSVLVHLDVAPWQGRQGRIFMVLAPQPIGRVDLTWTSHGLLLPGQMRDGERRLVYAGLITAPVIEDVQQLEIRADGNRLVRPEQMDVSFEMESESP